ncbi:hypothetical protein [Sanyastnella coralliicola]|uniref:hypothetical protein n=1 Tax=Sanyastnella coralliicola TaxID=3069118 RepID=UPI0027BAB206|nr:hypothetical protein [Longitalea sp. SCSIO 12813]
MNRTSMGLDPGGPFLPVQKLSRSERESVHSITSKVVDIVKQSRLDNCWIAVVAAPPYRDGIYVAKAKDRILGFFKMRSGVVVKSKDDGWHISEATHYHRLPDNQLL